MGTMLDVAAELERLEKEHAQRAAVIAYLKACLRQNGGDKPQPNTPPARRSLNPVGIPTHGPGIPTLVKRILQSRKRCTSKEVVEAIQSEYPRASADTIRTELWRKVQQGLAKQEKKGTGEYISLIYQENSGSDS